MLTKKQVERDGAALLAQMHGEGWTLDVWENLGWHYCVRRGPLSVRPGCNGEQHVRLEL
jgi:hypothetical protein